MAKKTSKKSTKKRGAAKRSSATRKKVTTKRAGIKRTAKRAARKPAKTRAVLKTTGAAQKRTTTKIARKTASKATLTAEAIRAAPQLAAAGSAPKAPLKRSSRLRAKDLAQFRESLLAKRGELIGDVTTLENEALSKSRQDAAGDLSTMPIHMADLGTDNYEQEFTLGLIEGERALLREIDEALERIEKGTYGICQATGKPIGKARLRARPWAKHCYEYVLAQETGQQSSGL